MDEPGLLSRKFGSRRDGMQEVIEVWDVRAPGCPVKPVHADTETVIERKWIPGIAESSVRLKEPEPIRS